MQAFFNIITNQFTDAHFNMPRQSAKLLGHLLLNSSSWNSEPIGLMLVILFLPLNFLCTLAISALIPCLNCGTNMNLFYLSYTTKTNFSKWEISWFPSRYFKIIFCLNEKKKENCAVLRLWYWLFLLLVFIVLYEHDSWQCHTGT
jgi:hypothetical protein